MEKSSSSEKIFAIVRDLRRQRSIFKIKFAPLNVPTDRRKQTLAALAWIVQPLVFGPLSWMLIIYFILYTTIAKYLALGYLLWMYMDKESCERGGRRSQWYRRLKWWDYYRDYFPVHLVKTTDLPPDRNYLFAVYPHGILSSGAFSAFATESLNFEKLFNGIKAYVCTLKINFSMPFVRELALAQGLVAASRPSLNWVLSSPGRGRAAVLVVGGAAEALYNKPGVYKIVLRNRKGFCKVALENGSPLVPVFSFGEIDLYDQIVPEHNSWLDMWQRWVKKVTGIAPVIFFGRGVFNYSFGLIPRRVPVTVVVGAPIEVEQSKNPTKEQVDALHKKFIESIVKLFNSEKHKYLEDPETELIIS